MVCMILAYKPRTGMENHSGNGDMK